MLPETATILLVDDSTDDRIIFCMCWTKAGIANPLVELEDGQQAIDYLAAASTTELPALVILDLKMPERNGFEVLEWMRAHPDLRRVPVIIVTASEQNTDIDRAYDLGVNSFLVKPSSAAELVELLRAMKDYWFRFNEFPKQPTAAPRRDG